MIEKKIQFPFYCMNDYILGGEIDFDTACENTMNEFYRLIAEYAENYEENPYE